jgi:hypothetical protein
MVYAHDSKSCGAIRVGSSPTSGTLRNHPSKVLISTIWRADLAYAVGLITTDGCLSSDARHIIFTSQDIDQIENIRTILGIRNRIGITRNRTSEAYRVQFGNVIFYDWLVSIGLMPNKSLVLAEMKIPEEFFIDYLRGHLDGDGSITVFIDRYNTKTNPKYIYNRLTVRFISASLEHILWLHEQIIRTVGVTGAIHKTKIRKENQNPIHIIKFGKKESLKLLERIYYSENIPALARKKAAYVAFLSKLNN